MIKTKSFDKNPKNREGASEHLWAPGDLKLTDKYKYVTNNVFIKIGKFIIVTFGLPFFYLKMKKKYDFEIIGKENADVLKNKSCITVSNHVLNLDSVMLTQAFYPEIPRIVSLKHNFDLFVLGGMIRCLGAIPLPDTSKREAFLKFQQDINGLLKKGKEKVHIFPEGIIEPKSRKIRNFQKGAFYFAVKNDVPILPMVFVFPDDKRVRLVVGKPIYKEDIKDYERLTDPKAVVAIAQKTKDEMQQLLDDYYGGEL